MRLILKSVVAAIFALTGVSCSNLGPAPAPEKKTPSYGIRIQSGNNQTGNVNGALTSSLVVLVTDKNTGSAVSNQAVAWTIASGGGSFAAKYDFSSPIGEAPATLKLGSSVGTNTVTASVSTGDSVTFTATGIIGPPASGTSSITASSPIIPDGINFSTITITLKDSSGNPKAGTAPTFTATGSGNNYGACSVSDSSGVSTCSLRSTTAETKILSITSPLTKVGGTVIFAPGPASAGNSSISGSSPAVANGVASSTLTITIRDASNVGIGGVVPTFAATDTGATNTYGNCSSTSASGASTCTLRSTRAETKTLSITSPVSVIGSTISFVAGPASSSTTTITGTGPTVNDGTTASTISIFLKDSFSNPVMGTVPTFSAGGSTNSYGTCLASDASGLSTCTLSSTTSETKVLSMVSPISMTGGSVVFSPGPVNSVNSSIVGSGPVIADGVATSMVTITLKDAANVAVSGVTPAFSAMNTGNTNNYSACSATNVSGVSTCTLSSTKAETKALTLTSPVNKTGGTVVFNPGPPSALTSTITGTGTVVANGVAQSTITLTIKDAQSNVIANVTPSFSATDTGTTNSYGGCSLTNASGVSTCILRSTRAELKNLSITTPVSAAGGTVTFVAGPATMTHSVITGSGPVPPDGASTSTISILLKDDFNNSVSGVTPVFSATDTGTTNTYGACSASSLFGASTCTLASFTAETKTLSLTSPLSTNGGIVTFAAGAASGANSNITGTGSVVANGSATSTITITLKDSGNIALVGVVPTFTATNTNNSNTHGSCTATNASGVSTCSLSSTKAEVKTLSIASPINKVAGTVTFTAGITSALTSQITGTSSVIANGTAGSTVTIVLYDANNNAVVGMVPTFSATNTTGGNVYGTCSSSSTSGSSTCTLKSTYAEVKGLSIATPVTVTGGSVTFIHGVTAATYTTITGSGPVVSDGASNSIITITLKDANDNPVNAIIPVFGATNTGVTNAYGTCSMSNTLGVSTCTLKSSNAETKVLSLTSPVAKTGGSVVFAAGPASAVNSTISGTSTVVANGSATSTISIVLKDASNIAIVGTMPTFSATNSGNGNIYGVCSASDSSGTSSCSLSSTKAEVKMLSIETPVVKAGGNVTFSAGIAAAVNSLITGTGPVAADGVSTSTISIVLYDANNNPVAGINPSFTATDTGASNVKGLCSTTSASGSSTCTLSSSTVELKTLQITSPVSKNGGTVDFFNSSASALTSTIAGTGPVNADGTASSTITITLKDGSNIAVVGTVPTFAATDTGSMNIYGTCSSSDASGVSTCLLRSTHAEVKTLSIVTPVAKTGGNVTFAQVVNAANSSINGTGPVAANGIASLTVTVSLRDYANIAVVGTTPTFTGTNTGNFNVYGTCTSTNASGTATCTLKSTQAETKTLNLISPVVVTGNNIVFTQVTSPSNSTINGTGPVLANGISNSSVTITLRDYTNGPMVAITPSFTATNTTGSNNYGACTVSNSSGVSTCTLSSSKSETKTLQVTNPIIFTGGTVQFL